MLKVRLFGLAMAGVLGLSTMNAATVTEDFSTDPLGNGWQVFGHTNLFQWDSTNHQLGVTWDSTQTNSYFYLPLTNIFTRADDFGMEFDLVLHDIASNVEPGKTGPLQLGIGFLNQAGAMSTNFMRGSFGNAPDVAEFDYYTQGYYIFDGVTYPAAPATFPSFISGVNSYDYDPVTVSVYDNELPTNQTIHVSFSYTGEKQTATLTVSTNGIPMVQLPPLPLDPTHGFVESDNVHLDMFSISSYSSVGDDFDSVLAHGAISNLTVRFQFRPVSAFTGTMISNGVWQGHFYGHENRTYTLERTGDLQSWTAAAGPVAGSDGGMLLVDTHAPAEKGFYRVKAEVAGP